MGDKGKVDRATHALARTGPLKGRGAASYVRGRFERTHAEAEDDGWGSAYGADGADGDDAPPAQLATTVTEERARTVISRNDSPDIRPSQSLNPYRGCEHGCVYCFARPSHAYLDLSPGLDFETRLFAKTNAPERLRAELARKGYVPEPIALGINTDAYQPIEREYRITRAVLEVLWEHRHPVVIVTKGGLVRRDLDLLGPMAAEGLAQVHVSVTTLDKALSAKLEPRAAAPHTRLACIRALHEAGVPVGVLVAPVIPRVTDQHLEHILAEAHAHGASAAGYVVLRLPHELKEVWREWLALHMPDRAAHVMSLVQQMHGGRDYDARFGVRQRGTGPFADLLAARFATACKRLGLGRLPALDTSRFRPPAPPPPPPSPQGVLF